MKIALSIIPKKIITQYNLRSLATDELVYMEIQKVMPGLKQAGKIANNTLKLHIAKFGYTPVPFTPYLWKYASKNVTFAVFVDSFGVKYVRKHQYEQLIQFLQ